MLLRMAHLTYMERGEKEGLEALVSAELCRTLACLNMPDLTLLV